MRGAGCKLLDGRGVAFEAGGLIRRPYTNPYYGRDFIISDDAL